MQDHQPHVNENEILMMPPAPQAENQLENEVEEYDYVAEIHAALGRLGLSQVAAQEFIVNGVNSTYRLHLLSTGDLYKLIKQIHCNNTSTGLFIPFMSQAYIHAVWFWANRMYIIAAEYDETLIDQEMANLECCHERRE
jgi:hypothetical protein